MDKELIKKIKPACSSWFPPDSVSLPSEPGTSVPPPKHDPCRFFKKGDRVRIKREINGRKLNHVFVNFSYDQTYTVAQDEEQKKYQSGLVKIINETGHTFTGSFYELELVTPVEELEPYYVSETDVEFQVRMKYEDKDCLISVFRFKNIVEGYKPYYDMLPTMKQARAAAEAERDRLNDEWQTKVCRSDGKEEV